MVDSIERISPRVTSESQLAEFSNHAFLHGVRQTSILGAPLRWVRGKVGLRRLVGIKLSEGEDRDFDLFGLFRFIALECIECWPHDSKEFRRQLYGQEYSRWLASGGGMAALLVGQSGDTKEWEKFRIQASDLQYKFDQTISRALQEGRILAGQDTRNGDRLVHPRTFDNAKVEELGKSYWFVASSDVPHQILGKDLPKEALRKKGAAFVEAAEAYFSARNLHLTATVAKEALVELWEHHGMTPNAAKDAWARASVQKRSLKNVKRENKVTRSNLMEFAESWRGK